LSNESATTKAACCSGCDDEGEKLRLIKEMTADYKARGKSLIQVLYMAQGMYGCLPMDVQKVIADGMGVPLAHVSSVLSFYSFFTTQPRGEHTIRVCLGTACYVRGGKKIVEELQKMLGIEVGETTADRKFTLEVVRCIGACGLAPSMMIDDDVFKQVRPEKLPAMLAAYTDSASKGDAAE